MAPLVSVVVPNYNYARFLPQAVASVAAQSYRHLELVVIDDGSTDDSLAVLEALREEYDGRFSGRFRIAAGGKNSGAHAALNEGIEMAAGKYVAVLNADDTYEPDRIEKMLDAAAGAGARLAFSDVLCVGRDGEVLEDEFAKKLRALPQSVPRHPFTAVAAVAENVAVSTGNLLMEKALHEELGGFRAYRYVHDYDFLLRAALCSEPVYVAGTNYRYRIHGDNSYTKLQDIGIAENRLVWLDAYARIKNGNIAHPGLLAAPDYRELFRQAANAYGFQKKMLWAIAGTWAGSVVAALMQRRLQRSGA